jgi:hypothetical protein
VQGRTSRVGRLTRTPAGVGGHLRDRRRKAAIGAAAFQRLRLLRQRKVLAHRGPCALGIVRPDRVVDVAVRLRRVLQVAPVRDRLLALLVEERRYHLDQRRQDGIARGGSHGPMEADVVNQKRMRIVQRCEHARDFLGNRRDVIVGGPAPRPGPQRRLRAHAAPRTSRHA